MTPPQECQGACVSQEASIVGAREVRNSIIFAVAVLVILLFVLFGR